MSTATQLAADREREVTTLLLHIAVSAPANAGELTMRIARPQQAIHDDLTSLMRDGIVHVHEGTLRTSAAPRLIAEADAGTIREIHDQVLAELRSGGAPRTSTLLALAESGCADEALLQLLTRALGTTPDDAAALSAFTMVARARNEDDAAQRIRRATDAAARCRPSFVLALTEELLDSKPSDKQRSAALLAAGAHLQSNRCERASAIYRSIGADHIGVHGAWAVVAAVGLGDLESAVQWRGAMPAHGLTSYSAGMSNLADGLIASLNEAGPRALDLLAKSASALTPIGADQVFPESPAALAALVAFGTGDPATAEIILTRALQSHLGGEGGRRRHLLLLSWGLMVQGRLDAAEQHVARCGKPQALSERDLLLYWCLQGGIARRRADLSAMYNAWREIRGHTFGLRLTLFDLLALGEMMVLAARLRDEHRIEQLVIDATDLLQSLDHPPVWAAPFFWQGVQSAFQAEDPASLIPYAQALAHAGAESPYAAVLATAGHTWLEVLRGESDADSVERSVRALASIGHTWDASRLAGQAALQHPERESALSLMQLAREVMREQGSHASAVKPSVLTAREVEVARLVLDGHGYRSVGEQLYISPKTVEHHVARIKGRVGASNRAELLEKLHDLLAEDQASSFLTPPGA
ncbi:LuxR C-terminal-related transcriptional regulator [Leucobacter albus]|uniref:LuxR C-terminal-related transcriptional regulator n=1 Tax=Leucobacter albus TaxID=272210 RepID=A0ABW3TLI7_9MICO